MLGGTSSITSFKTLILQIGKLIRILRAASLELRSPGWQSLGASWELDHSCPPGSSGPDGLHSLQMPVCPALLSCVFARSALALWNALSPSWTFFVILQGVPQMSLFLEFSKLGQILFCRPHTVHLCVRPLVQWTASALRTVFCSSLYSSAWGRTWHGGGTG